MNKPYVEEFWPSGPVIKTNYTNKSITISRITPEYFLTGRNLKLAIRKDGKYIRELEYHLADIAEIIKFRIIEIAKGDKNTSIDYEEIRNNIGDSV